MTNYFYDNLVSGFFRFPKIGDESDYINSDKMLEKVIKYNDDIVKKFLKESVEVFCADWGCIFEIKNRKCNLAICKKKFLALGYQIENEVADGFYVCLPTEALEPLDVLEVKQNSEVSEPEESFVKL